MSRISKHFHYEWCPVPCTRCEGTGTFYWQTSDGTASGDCFRCDGSGKKKDRNLVWDNLELTEAEKNEILEAEEKRKSGSHLAKLHKRANQRNKIIQSWIATLSEAAQNLAVFAIEQGELTGQIASFFDGGNVSWAVDNQDPSIEEIAGRWPTVWERYESIRHPYGRSVENTKCRFVGTVMHYFGRHDDYIKIWVTEIDGKSCGFIAKIKDQYFKKGKEYVDAEVGDTVEFNGWHGKMDRQDLQNPTTQDYLIETWINRTSRERLKTK